MTAVKTRFGLRSETLRVLQALTINRALGTAPARAMDRGLRWRIKA